MIQVVNCHRSARPEGGGLGQGAAQVLAAGQSEPARVGVDRGHDIVGHVTNEQISPATSWHDI
jgi:hypothetical protein